MLRVRTEFGSGARKATISVRSFCRNNPQIWLGAMQTTEPFTSLLPLPFIGCEQKHEVSFPIYRSDPAAQRGIRIRKRRETRQDFGVVPRAHFCARLRTSAPRLRPNPRRTFFGNALKRNKKKQNEIILISGNLR